MHLSLRPFLILTVAAQALLLAACQRSGRESNESGVFRVVAFKATAEGFAVANGTAFKVHGSSSVVTNQHVIEDAGAIRLVYWRDGQFESTEVRVVTADAKRDVALLRAIRPLPGEPFRLAAYEPTSGSQARAIGYPSAADALFGGARTLEEHMIQLTRDPGLNIQTRTFGSISSARKLESVEYVQHQVPISPGNSGGPLIDACDNVIGMNTVQAKGANSIFGAVRSTEIIETMRLHDMAVEPVASRCWAILDSRNQLYAAASVAVVAAGLMGLLFATAFMFRRGRRVAAPIGRSDVIEIEPLPLGPPSPGHHQQQSPAGSRAGAPAAKILEPSLEPSPAGWGRLVPLGTKSAAYTVSLNSSRPLIIGRSPGADITIDDPTVSREHCKLSPGLGGTARLVDLSSGNGTRVNGLKVSERIIRIGDTITFGSVEFKLEPPSARPLQLAANAITLRVRDEQGKPMQFSLDVARQKRVWTIGRSAAVSEIAINCRTISAQHAAIRLNGSNQWEIQDKGSSNGTVVGGVRVGAEWTPVDLDARVMLGGCELRLTRS